ncbi:hypothetical protein CN946_06635 [Bacillus sp. AFS053548]|nr:hypothetical protein CN946_06635 [Bacillus sp. AFS053548]
MISGAWLVQVIGIVIFVCAILHTKERHAIARNRGSIYFTVELFLFMPWYVLKSVFILLGAFFILLPLIS